MFRRILNYFKMCILGFHVLFLIDFSLDIVPLIYHAIYVVSYHLIRVLFSALQFIFSWVMIFLAPVFQLLNTIYCVLDTALLVLLHYCGVILNFGYWLLSMMIKCLAHWYLPLLQPLFKYLASKPMFASIYKFLLVVLTSIPTEGILLITIAALGLPLLNRDILSFVLLGLFLGGVALVALNIIPVLIWHVVPVISTVTLFICSLLILGASLLGTYRKAAFYLQSLIQSPLKSLKNIHIMSWIKWSVTSALLIKMTASLVFLSLSLPGWFFLSSKLWWVTVNMASCLSVVLSDLLWMSSNVEMRWFYEDLAARLCLFFVASNISVQGLLPTFGILNLIPIIQACKESHVFSGDYAIKKTDIQRRFEIQEDSQIIKPKF